MRERSDETLMKAYAGGNMEAFELLYSRHRGPLYRYILPPELASINRPLVRTGSSQLRPAQEVSGVCLLARR